MKRINILKTVSKQRLSKTPSSNGGCFSIVDKPRVIELAEKWNRAIENLSYTGGGKVTIEIPLL